MDSDDLIAWGAYQKHFPNVKFVKTDPEHLEVDDILINKVDHFWHLSFIKMWHDHDIGWEQDYEELGKYPDLEEALENALKENIKLQIVVAREAARQERMYVRDSIEMVHTT